jgi:hypothetical protein
METASKADNLVGSGMGTVIDIPSEVFYTSAPMAIVMMIALWTLISSLKNVSGYWICWPCKQNYSWWFLVLV